MEENPPDISPTPTSVVEPAPPANVTTPSAAEITREPLGTPVAQTGTDEKPSIFGRVKGLFGDSNSSAQSAESAEPAPATEPSLTPTPPIQDQYSAPAGVEPLASPVIEPVQTPTPEPTTSLQSSALDSALKEPPLWDPRIPTPPFGSGDLPGEPSSSADSTISSGASSDTDPSKIIINHPSDPKDPSEKFIENARNQKWNLTVEQVQELGDIAQRSFVDAVSKLITEGATGEPATQAPDQAAPTEPSIPLSEPPTPASTDPQKPGV